uniref:ATP-binding cassette sub-family C member 10 n=1 Tax=Lepisosteus oculatus TaxID=7918 RepID=W5NJ59_LEPOC|nr:PREDICTED: multidrug resistance-associated protein 7 [Lepisosteus oculatus]XP_015218555.1 PREDICTED: multidrug resistance-associated protein 7 [Lepisosteus oculatus]XP_015218556.1 PREDICTED: multidrug resistance-associated protein 7 [Lepisosteus oculatus]XP_015218557.1 PREDICTED: multidrug resistance-associated protein 7 [Lepisosteus oculatus]XP_015218558.1 PREDICTED: multidrug resistance-associated protein 7 [Lepisosteus oculatus]XP_015218559.1 PREDICTED: multidrug resistance-associated pr
MAHFLAELCHTDSLDPLPVWQNGTISPCFSQLFLGALAHSVLALSSACYLSTPSCAPAGGPPAWGWLCRAAAAALLALLFTADLAVSPLLRQPALYLDVLADGAAVLAWLVHCGALAALRRSAYGRGRGPPELLVSALLPGAALVVSLVSYLRDPGYLDPGRPLRLLRLAAASARLLLLCLYLLAWAAPGPGARASLSVNDSERAPLLAAPGPGEIVGEDGSGCISRLFYFWLNPLMQRGRRRELESYSDLYLLPRGLRTSAVREHFERCWEECRPAAQAAGPRELGRSAQKGAAGWPEPPEAPGGEGGPLSPPTPEVRLLRVLHAAFGTRYYLLGALKLAGNMLGFAGPLLLNSLVSFMEAGAAPLSRGVWCALGLFASTFLAAVLRNVFTFEVSKISLAARSAIISAIYRKALCVSGTTLARFTLGEVVNFMSTDTDRLVNFFGSFHEVWSLPVQFAITLYLLDQQVGVAFLGGLALALLLVPLNKVIASRIMENNKSMLKHKDSRVKLMTEVLSGMRVIKFYTWEKHFAEKIAGCRKQELAHLKTIKYLDAVCVYTWAALPVVISIITFITYVLLGHELTAAKVFTALALVGMLIMPLNNFPWVLNGTIEAKVSLDRIQRFLELSDQDLDAYYSSEVPEDPQTAIQLKHGAFSWQGPASRDPPAGGSLQLHSLDLTVRQGALVAVVGKVGCGKSSLLAAITGELNRCGGLLYVQGRELGFGLAAQEPWIQHASVRDNILFGKEHSARLYRAVLEACALPDDLSILPSGDLTEVGENGVTLSGGQKARLALARAVYMEKDIYLLDDPLAAVDADVASHLLEKCILGILKHKTRILCTHRTEFLDKADVVVLMDEGKIVKTGTPEEILPLVEAVPKTRKNDDNRKEKDGAGDEQRGLQPADQAPVEASLLGEEQKQSGVVSLRVYRAYWLAVGSCLALSILLSLLLMQASKNVSEWWLSNWVSHLKKTDNVSLAEGDPSLLHLSPRLLLFSLGGLLSPVPLMGSAPSPNSSSDLKYYLTVYGSIAAGNSVFTAIRAFLFAYGAVRAATAVHDRLLDRVLKATVTFFDTTPLGRIVNRFSSDLYSVDDTLPFILNILLANAFGLLGMLVVMSYGLPWILLVLLPLAGLYYLIQRYYRHSSRELKRLYSLTLSPIYTHFSETLTGLSTIRASRAAPRFEKENESRLERNQRCLFASNAAMQWLDIRLQMIGVAVVTGIAVIAVIQHQKKSVDPGLVGLSLSYALSITSLLSGLIFSFTQTETQMVSVERTEEYSTDTPIEPQGGCVEVPPSWPHRGQIEFQEAVLAYRAGLPNALDGVSVVIRPGEKVGIVGRTGSGKSTMFLALFRMVELSGGQILVDGVDTRLLGLTDLRSQLAVIPQDPFLFSGTVRENLDPRGRQPDAALLEVLEECHLTEAVARMGGLAAEVGEKGKSLSLGQRQLLCLARALLTQAKILCIDEATASVDQKTDRLLQQTIREKFREKTVLTIAHRINTIMDSDKVLVMHAGKVAEFESPSILCQREDSIFYRLVHGHTD